MKFRRKYRINSSRLRHWNYGWAALYFITICTKNRIYYFGNILDGKMKLSAIGKITHQEWLQTFEMRQDMNLSMGEFVIMPNHFHAIIGIGENPYNSDKCRGAMHCAPTFIATNTKQNRFGPQSKNLASIIRGFKSAVTKNARLIESDFTWQSRFHDHIIRNEIEAQKISEYIRNNPLLWENDTFNPKDQNKDK